MSPSPQVPLVFRSPITTVRPLVFLLSKEVLKLVTDVFLLFLLCVICWCMDLNYRGVLALLLKPGNDNPLGDWFRLLPASLDRISATPFSCSALAPARLEQSTVFPDTSWTFPAPVHLVSLIPRVAIYSLFISLEIWCTLPIWYIVRTSHVPIRVLGGQ